MIDNELARQLREVTGETVASCDLCGQPVEEPIAVALNRQAATGVADRLVRVCGSCFERIERGELPVNPNHDPEDDLAI